MRSINNRSVFSHLIVFVLTIAILTGQSMFVFALPEKNSAAGEITVTAAANATEKPFVMVNGEAAYSGRTFFSNGTITTTQSTASIDFGKIGRVNLGPDSTLTLSVSATNITGTLSSGSISVANGDGVGVKIVTPDDTISNEGTSATRFTVNVAADISSVAAQSGIVRYNNGETIAKQDDDDDDDDGSIWLPVVVFGGTIAAVLFFSVLRDDDDEIVSPVR